MFDLDNETLHIVLRELEQAQARNEKWRDNVMRTLVCALPGDPRDLADDAYRRCSFGRWYFGGASPSVREHPAFAAVDREHRLMHQAAARLLRASSAGVAPSTEDYDEFVRRTCALHQAIAAVRHEAEAALGQRDSLTGARSRASMAVELNELHEQVKRRVQTCCIAFMDLDHFKAINDRYGHAIGDQVLAACVGYAKTHLRPFDRIFRYGGEEFVIAMPGVDLESARRIVERIRIGLAGQELARHEGLGPVCCTVSFGLAMMQAELSVNEAVERADRAMYQAKQQGRNRVVTYSNPAS